jgi:CDP-diacylglycerol pyrophosphatase
MRRVVHGDIVNRNNKDREPGGCNVVDNNLGSLICQSINFEKQLTPIPVMSLSGGEGGPGTEQS